MVMIAQQLSSDLANRIFKAKQLLAQQLMQLKGQWVIIDLRDQRIFFNSNDMQEAIKILIRERRGEDLYLEHVGEPITIAHI